LMARADLERRLEQLKGRLLRNAKVQEGDEPAEKIDVLLDEVERASTELTQYVQRINRTNGATVLEGAMTIADAIAVRDGMRKRFAIYNELVASAGQRNDYYSRSEVRYVRMIDVAAVQTTTDQLARQARELDARIQAMNWQVDLMA
jgi:predicted RND superfamily exporter protein